MLGVEHVATGSELSLTGRHFVSLPRTNRRDKRKGPLASVRDSMVEYGHPVMKPRSLRKLREAAVRV